MICDVVLQQLIFSMGCAVGWINSLVHDLKAVGVVSGSQYQVVMGRLDALASGEPSRQPKHVCPLSDHCALEKSHHGRPVIRVLVAPVCRSDAVFVGFAGRLHCC